MSSGGFEAQCAHTHTHVHIKNRIVAVGFTTNQRNNNKHKTVRFNKWVFIFLLRSFFRHFTSISIRFSLSLWTMRSSVMVNSEWDTFRWDLMTCFWWPCYGSHIRNASIFSKVFYEFLAFWVDLQINCMCVLQLIRSVIFLCWWNDGKKNYWWPLMRCAEQQIMNVFCTIMHAWICTDETHRHIWTYGTLNIY